MIKFIKKIITAYKGILDLEKSLGRKPTEEEFYEMLAQEEQGR